MFFSLLSFLLKNREKKKRKKNREKKNREKKPRKKPRKNRAITSVLLQVSFVKIYKG
jgi:hypothetical protein